MSGDAEPRAGGARRPGSGQPGRSTRTVILAGAVLLVLAVVALVVISGGGPGGQAPLTENPTDDQDGGNGAPGTTATDGSPSGDVETSGDGTEPTLAEAVETDMNGSSAPANLTIRIDTRATDPTGTYVENRTIRLDRRSDRFLVERRQVFDSNGTMTVETTIYATEATVFERTKIAGDNESVGYARANRTGDRIPVDGSTFQSLFDFEHERTDGGDHLFTADSVGQYTGPKPDNGTLVDVSAMVIVDAETGLLTRARFRVVGEVDGERVRKRTEMRVTAIGETTVREPDWLSTARNRTAG